ncbi:hypothetical protein ACD661_15755 [Legionella lytica]|uniref:Transmembrane protein n=1 Tax=Legionella lytica TaxID=96232 RepID=A0ABW8DEN9_9GAMM
MVTTWVVEKRVRLGWLAGIFIYFLLGYLGPSPACNDGSVSYSIGRRGACSHHGGVDHHSLYHLFVIFSGIIVGSSLTYLLTPQSERDQKNGQNIQGLPCQNIEDHLLKLKENGIPDFLIEQERKRLNSIINSAKHNET